MSNLSDYLTSTTKKRETVRVNLHYSPVPSNFQTPDQKINHKIDSINNQSSEKQIHNRLNVFTSNIKNSGL